MLRHGVLVRHPQQRSRVGNDGMMHHAVLLRHFDALEPWGKPPRDVFLPETFFPDSCGVAFHCHWPAAQMRKKHPRHRFVISSQISFGDAIIGKQHLLGMRNQDRSLVSARHPRIIAVFPGTSRCKCASKSFVSRMLPSTYPVLDLHDAPRFDGRGNLSGEAYRAKAERDRLRLLAEVSESIASHPDLNELFHDLAQRLPRIVPFDYINVVLHDAASNVMRLHLLAAPVESTIKPGDEFPVDDSPGGFVWKTQAPVIVNDITLEARFN